MPADNRVVTRRVDVTVDHRRHTLEIRVDFDAIAHLLARRAVRSKHSRSIVASGAVRVVNVTGSTGGAQ